MSQPAPPTGPTNSVPARLVRADGTTVITATSGASLVSVNSSNDPWVTVSENIYQDSVFTGTNYPSNERQLKFHAGQVIRQSAWNACFAAATIAGVSPATGPRAGGTRVTITGTGFTPDTTVQFGANPATSVVAVSPTEITCVTPSATGAGAASVSVVTDAGTVTQANAYTYT